MIVGCPASIRSPSPFALNGIYSKTLHGLSPNVIESSLDGPLTKLCKYFDFLQNPGWHGKQKEII